MQIVYTCPICGQDLKCVMLPSNPSQTRYECWGCGWSFYEARPDVVRIPYPDVNNAWHPANEACESCGNNPKNGGSGICNCTARLGNVTIC